MAGPKCQDCGGGLKSDPVFTLVCQGCSLVCLPIECEKCGKRFAQNSLLRKHVSAVHDQTNDKVGGARKFQCPYCPSQFKRKDHVDRHITHLHSIVPDAKLFECVHPNCGKRFQSAGRLQQHNKLHEDHSTHPCPICGKTILRKKNLSIQKKMHYRLHLKTLIQFF